MKHSIYADFKILGEEKFCVVLLFLSSRDKFIYYRGSMEHNFFTNNCLSLIRLLAAIQVMFGHLTIHLNIPVPYLTKHCIGYLDGVPIFFAISGLVIWGGSIERSDFYKVYLRKRFWRIYPELWMAVILEILSIVIFYKGWNWKHLFVFTITQGTILQFWTPRTLRGYGCGTPNGTLWTMCVTIQFYVISWFLYKLMHKKSIKIWTYGFIITVAISYFGQMAVELVNSEIIIKLFGQTIFRYLWLFYIGCCIAEHQNILIFVMKKYWSIFFIGGLVPYIIGMDLNAGYDVFRCILIICGVIGFAYKYPQLQFKTDISYGLFLYHMIIVNVFITIGWTGSWLYAISVLALTIVCAYFSTITIGKWCVQRRGSALKVN